MSDADGRFEIEPSARPEAMAEGDPNAAPAPKRSAAVWGIVAGACIVIAGLIRIFGGFDKNSQLEEANKRIEEVRETLNQATAMVVRGDEAGMRVLNEESLGGFPDNRTDLKPDAQQAMAFYSQAAQKFDEAAAKFHEAAEMRVEQPLKDYWNLKARQMTTIAEERRATASQYAVIVDETSDRKQLIETRQAVVRRVESLTRQANTLSEQADQIAVEHPELFKKEPQ